MPVAQLIRLRVQPDFRDRVIAVQLANVAGSRNEPGCLRFDLAADETDPTLLYLWEVFESEAALESHRRTPHFLAWRALADSLPEGAVVRERIGLEPLTP
ncbi:MAG TPA: putative quinol monooxygenase [Azospirillaceae bacterium]|nr:putative quinol monooxygenase [Azospirillaceae bacterium]